jgi:DNA-binding CsgD family transcriptional regulator
MKSEVENDAGRLRPTTGQATQSEPQIESKSGSVPEFSDASPLRSTGIRMMGDLAWGTHIRVFYETQEDLFEMNRAYIEAGLRRNEFCIWAVSDPATVVDAENFLRKNIAEFEQCRAVGQLEILPDHAWQLWSEELDAHRIAEGWHRKLHSAVSNGFEGMRVSGNALWLQEHRWTEFGEYERAVNQVVSGQKIIVMCAYPLRASRAIDLLEAVRAHHFTIARHDGKWDLLQSPEPGSTRDEIKQLRSGMNILSRPFPGHELLTPQERVVLAQIVGGASSKEAGRALGLSHRTIDFHRRNIMQKLGAGNIAELLVTILADHAKN